MITPEPLKAKPIVQYKHALLKGKPCMVHAEFVPAMDLFCRYLEIVKCSADINSSYRANAENINGAVVKPARRSNHMVGFAIDCNLVDSKGAEWSSGMMKIFCPNDPLYNPRIVNEISQFIGLVRRSKTLRYGGDFQTPDPIHYDTGINISNPTKWDELYAQIWAK